MAVAARHARRPRRRQGRAGRAAHLVTPSSGSGERTQPPRRRARRAPVGRRLLDLWIVALLPRFAPGKAVPVGPLIRHALERFRRKWRGRRADRPRGPEDRREPRPGRRRDRRAALPRPPSAAARWRPCTGPTLTSATATMAASPSTRSKGNYILECTAPNLVSYQPAIRASSAA